MYVELLSSVKLNSCENLVSCGNNSPKSYQGEGILICCSTGSKVNENNYKEDIGWQTEKNYCTHVTNISTEKRHLITVCVWVIEHDMET